MNSLDIRRGRGRPVGSFILDSKMHQARRLITNYLGLPRRDVVDLVASKLNLKKTTANTYYYRIVNCKSSLFEVTTDG